VRNPIFTFMMVATVGAALLLPTWTMAAALVSVLLGLELQVRFVEERYLRRVHGADYAIYAAHVGRFLPWIGRLPCGTTSLGLTRTLR
jgi:protein-S-isoprenylcysteine O-methyltransferase Ste14